MNLRLTVVFLMFVLVTGCAAQAPRPTGVAADPAAGTSVMGAEPALRGALIFECPTKCSVSAGPGCC